MKKRREITDYDEIDTTEFVDRAHPKSLDDLGIKLAKAPPTQVVSIRLPTPLLNKIRSKASSQDIPYQALIKMLLAKTLHYHP